MRLRRGDVWKAVLLAAAIVLVVGFSIYNLRRLSRSTRPAPAAGTPTPAAMPAGTRAELFAPRQTAAPELLARARVAADPFRPYLSLAAPAPEPPPPAPPKATTRVQPLPALPGDEADRTALEVVVIVTGTSTLAVLGNGKQRYYVRTGDLVVDGWRVTAIRAASVTISKGSTQVALPLTAPPP